MEEELELLAFLMVVLIAVIVSPKAKKIVQKFVDFSLRVIKVVFIIGGVVIVLGLIVGAVWFIITWLRDRWYAGDKTLVGIIGFALFLSILPFLPKSIQDFFIRYYSQPLFTPSSKKCPSDQLLGDYLSGLLYDGVTKPIKKHLSTCEKCKIRVEKSKKEIGDSHL